MTEEAKVAITLPTSYEPRVAGVDDPAGQLVTAFHRHREIPTPSRSITIEALEWQFSSRPLDISVLQRFKNGLRMYPTRSWRQSTRSSPMRTAVTARISAHTKGAASYT